MRSVDICIPAYNEADVIGDTVREIVHVLDESAVSTWRIIVADNCSTDGTAETVERLGLSQVSALRVPGKGKGRAIRECAALSHADYFGFLDADLSASPEHIGQFLDELAKGAGLVIGSRLKDARTVNRGFLRTLSSRMFNWYAQRMLSLGVADTQCGFKFMTADVRDLLKECREATWFLDLELLALARQTGHTLVELPVKWSEYRYTNRKSKLNIARDGLAAAVAIARVRRRHF